MADTAPIHYAVCVWPHSYETISARTPSSLRTKLTTAKELTMESGSTTLSADAQAILESMGDAFYALDGEWRIVYANRRALAFWGVSADEVVGRVIWERFPQLLDTVNERVLRQVREDRQVITFEAPSPTTGVWVSVNALPKDWSAKSWIAPAR
jgi:PAS domain S-box-containing protein